MTEVTTMDKDDRERGASVVEFAVVLTLLAPLIVVIVAWGIRFHNAAQADNAAFIAARYYAIKCSTDGSAATNAKAAGAAATSLVTAGDITIVGSCTSGETITARVSKSQSWSPTVPFFGMSGSYPLVGEGAARCE
jgi:Flp pilus assembly protein TadG